MLCVLICFLAVIYGFNIPDIQYSVYTALWRLPRGHSLHVNVFYSLSSRSTGVGNQVQGTYRGYQHNELVFKGIVLVILYKFDKVSQVEFYKCLSSLLLPLNTVLSLFFQHLGLVKLS